MHPQLIKLLSLSALTGGILAASNGARADEGPRVAPEARPHRPRRVGRKRRPRLVRRHDEGLQVIAWSLRDGRWLRWTSRGWPG